MANPDDILLKLKTEADTSGAEAVEESLKKLQEDTFKATQKAAADSAAAGDDQAKAARRLEYELGKVRAVQEEVTVTGFGGMNKAAESFAEKVTESAQESVKEFTEVKKSIFAVEDAAKTASKELDVIEAKRRQAARENKGGLLGVDLTGKVDDYGKQIANLAGVGDTFEKVSKIVGADGAAVAGSIALVGVAAVKSYQALSDTVKEYEKFYEEAKARGQEVRPELQDAVTALKASLGGLPELLTNVQEGFAEMWKAVSNPIDTLSGLGDLREALEREATSAKALGETRKRIADENQNNLKKIYGEELAVLREQEAALQRIAALRSKKFDLAQQGASQEIESARLRGGDVALAQANALALEIQVGITQLNDDFNGVKAEAETARREFDLASIAYQQAIRDGLDKLDPEKFAAISGAVDAKQKAFRDSDQAVKDQEGIFNEAKNNLLRGAENKLAALDTDTTEAITAASTAARNKIYQTLKDEVAKGPVEAVAAIQTSVQPVTDSAKNKAAEVKAGIDVGVKNVTEDGNKLVNEVAQFVQAQTQLRSTQENLNTLVKEGFLAGERATAALLTTIQPVVARILALEGQISDLQQQLGTK